MVPLSMTLSDHAPSFKVTVYSNFSTKAVQNINFKLYAWYRQSVRKICGKGTFKPKMNDCMGDGDSTVQYST